MLKYKHILLAVALSDSTDQIAQRAADIQAASNATLSIIHVIEHSPIVYGGEFSIPVDINLEQQLTTFAQKGLAKLGEKYAVSPDQLFLESTSVKTDVINTAKKIKADLIIVGSHGKSGLDVLLGSRANAILHAAPCDVLVVRITD